MGSAAISLRLAVTVVHKSEFQMKKIGYGLRGRVDAEQLFRHCGRGCSRYEAAVEVHDEPVRAGDPFEQLREIGGARLLELSGNQIEVVLFVEHGDC